MTATSKDFVLDRYRRRPWVTVNPLATDPHAASLLIAESLAAVIDAVDDALDGQPLDGAGRETASDAYHRASHQEARRIRHLQLDSARSPYRALIVEAGYGSDIDRMRADGLRDPLAYAVDAHERNWRNTGLVSLSTGCTDCDAVSTVTDDLDRLHRITNAVVEHIHDALIKVADEPWRWYSVSWVAFLTAALDEVEVLDHEIRSGSRHTHLHVNAKALDRLDADLAREETVGGAR